MIVILWEGTRLRTGDLLGGGVFVVDSPCMSISVPKRSFSSSFVRPLLLTSLLPLLCCLSIGINVSGAGIGRRSDEAGSLDADLTGMEGFGLITLVFDGDSEDLTCGTRSELMRNTGETLLADIARSKYGDSSEPGLVSLGGLCCLRLSACGACWACGGLASDDSIFCCPGIEGCREC